MRKPALLEAAWVLIVSAVIAVPLTFDLAANDTFRAPKMFLLRAVGLTLIAVSVYWRVSGRRFSDFSLRPPDLLLTALIVGWTTVSTAFSSNHYESVDAWVTVVCCAAFFVATRLLSASRSITAVYALLVAAVVNAIFLLLQQTGAWNPFADMASRAGLDQDAIRALSESALVGNVSDVGGSLVLCVIVGVAAAVSDRRPGWRIAAALSSVVAVTGVVATASRGAIAACAAGLLVMIMWLRPRYAIAMIVTVGVVFVVGLKLHAPLRWRVSQARTYVKEGRWDSLLSGRTIAYLAATQMARDHPLLGVGPAAFAANYFDYKICAEAKHAGLFVHTAGGVAPASNFGQVHNDHLQVLAELGLPGYGLMLAAIGVVASVSLRRRAPPPNDPRRRFVTTAAAAAAVALTVSALAQFPIQLAASAVGYLYFAALCCAWSTHETP